MLRDQEPPPCWRICFGEMELVSRRVAVDRLHDAYPAPETIVSKLRDPIQPCEEVQPRGRRVKATINNPARRPAALSFTSLGVSTFGVGGASRHA